MKVTEGDCSEDGMIHSNVSLSIARIVFSLPNELLHHSSLIHSFSSTASALSVFCCSFACREATKETNYCLMKADGGSVAIEDCSISQFSLAKGFVEFTADVMMVDVVNVSISNTTISGCSLISLIQLSPTNMLISNERVNTRQTVRVNGSSFTNITCTENRACALSVGSFSAGVECVVEGCELRKCMSESSEEGGGMRVLLKRGKSELKVSGCTFGMCVCSTANGMGGGMMIDALDPNRVPDQMPALPLGLRMENIRFMMNDAFVGKDVFIRCDSIDLQINETLFSLDFSQEALKLNNSVCGSDASGGGDVDLIPLITFYFAVQVFANVGGKDSRQCGAQKNPCKSISCSASHIQRGVANMIFVDGEGDIGGECVIGDLCVKSVKKTKATIHFNATIQEMGNETSVIVFVNECVAERCAFEFGEMFEANHRHILKVQNGTTELRECEFSSSSFGHLIKNSIMTVEGGELEMDKCEMVRMKTSVPLIEFIGESKAFISETKILNISSEENAIEVGGRARVQMKELDAQNITLLRSGSAVKMQNLEKNVVLSNCSFGKCLSEKEKGSIASVDNCSNVNFDLCIFLGDFEEDSKTQSIENGRKEEICRWNGSVVDFESSKVMMKDTAIFNSSKGGMTVSGGAMNIKDGRFENNNPFFAKYPSLRRNIICSDSASLTISSLKGGDGVMPNSSLWILDDGCSLEGMAGERESPFFIPKLEGASASENGGGTEIQFKGALLLPCDLSFRLILSAGDTDLIETYHFEEDGFASEAEAVGMVPSRNLSSIPDETEVSVMIVYGKRLSATDSFILKNRSDPKANGDERIAEGGKEGKSYWLLIVVIFAVLFLIVLIISVIFIVRWKKVKNEAEDLREIVNDNIRKDPKAFEMVTMEMSPEEQWRRAEREAEKKNDERIKKRVYAKSLGHSESSEHLLSESGSTEYILGRDSDKIPQWMLEKVDEKEDDETRKRTPSPSVSSASTTDTSDTESTFVRGEDLCPTTSSMSNLVDAMACSSPHEKLIVDLRDSLFMLLHGRNEKKEMAIGTLKEREQTAAQILFWVANGALHSFDEMENPLQSLANLSPHIVLFSEHMVICIVMHSDLLSDDDSDSTSISSSTVVTSASDDDEEDSLPSSAFEDEDYYKKECLRWKAPELQMNKKMGATEKSVAFSIGMMLWECLTLQIPFGEYEAEAAGQKIVNGEVPNVGLVKDTPYLEFWRLCVSWNEADRPSLSGMKRELVGHFPAGAVMVTLTDAICDSLRDDEEEEEEEEEEGMEEEENGMSEAISKEEGRKSRKYL